MPCSKRGQSGDLEYKKIIASPAGKVNRNSPTKNALGKFSSDGIFPPRQHFGSVRRRETPARCRAQAFGRSPTGASRPGPPPPLWGRRERAFGAWAVPEFTAFSELRKNKSSGQKNSPRRSPVGSRSAVNISRGFCGRRSHRRSAAPSQWQPAQ